MSELYQNIKLRAIKWMERRLPPCEAITPLLSQSMERELSFRERTLMKLHLLICIWCKRYGRQVRFMRETVRQYPVHEEEDETSTSLSPEARERIRRALTEKNL